MHIAKTFIYKSFQLIILFVFLFVSSHAQDIVAGEKIFKANCASCHYPDKKGTGPALKGALTRWNGDKEAIYSWVKNSQAVIKSGNPYAVKLYEEYNKSVMTAFPQLSNADIDNVLAYVEAYKPKVVADAGAASGVKNAKKDEGLNWNLLMLCGVLLLLVILLSRTTTSLETAVNNAAGETIYETAPFYRARWFRTALSIFTFCLIGYTTYDQAAALGRQKDYSPEQPIKFSHELHAGTHQIECLYCHSSADKSKVSSVPSTNICMNCHKAIQEGPQYGTTEIAKIYDAAGWDVDKQAYTNPGHEIEWVRIHNLPDHVYFNHAQHVTAGKIKCQKCHGEIQTMEKVAQHSSLSMGWCINCHRETEVQFTENNFYKMYEDYHHELEEAKKDGKSLKITEANMGGEECMKCHY